MKGHFRILRTKRKNCYNVCPAGKGSSPEDSAAEDSRATHRGQKELVPKFCLSCGSEYSAVSRNVPFLRQMLLAEHANRMETKRIRRRDLREGRCSA